jgi:hypothetical protein
MSRKTIDTPVSNGEVATAMPPSTWSGPISKAEAVRRLMAETPDLKPQEAVIVIKERFGVELAPGHFSSYRSQLKARNRETSAETLSMPRPSRKPTPTTDDALPSASDATNALLEAIGKDLLADLRILRAMIDTRGIGEVQRLVDFLDNRNR